MSSLERQKTANSLSKRKIGLSILALFLILAGLEADAEGPPIQNDHFWNDFQVDTKINDQWSFFARLSLRQQIEERLPYQYILPRFILSRKISEGQSIGYGWENVLNSPNGDDDMVYESRNTVTHQFNNPFSFVKSVRTRVEFRKIEGSANLRLRLRHRWYFKPIWESGPYSLTFDDELFVYLNPETTSSGYFFSENRAKVLLHKKLSPTFKAYIGYMNQYKTRTAEDEILHTWRTGLTYSFN